MTGSTKANRDGEVVYFTPPLDRADHSLDLAQRRLVQEHYERLAWALAGTLQTRPLYIDQVYASHDDID